MSNLVSKKELITKIKEIMLKLDFEELTFLYNSGHFTKSPDYKIIRFINGELVRGANNEKVSTQVIIEFVLKELDKENSNYSTANVFNTIQSAKKATYKGDLKFELV